MNSIKALAGRTWRHFMHDSLYRNSIYLMASTAVMSLLGFIFWAICARLYSAHEIGLATALIATSTLIASFSLLGINNALIRFLPKTENRMALVNTTLNTITIVAIFVSVVYLLGLTVFSPKLLFIRDDIATVVAFIFFMLIATVNVTLDSLYIAYRSAGYVLIKNSVLSVTKVALPVCFVAFHTFGIFAAVSIGTLIGVIVSLVPFVRRHDISLRPTISRAVLKKVARYSFGNYIAGFLNGLPAILLPIIIVNRLSTELTAYFYFDMMIVGILFIIPQAATQSFFAEGAHSEESISDSFKRSIRLVFMLLTPAIIGILLFGYYVLMVFGHEYAEGATSLLRILAVSSVFIAINSMFTSYLRVKNLLGQLILITGVGVGFLLGLSALLAPRGLNAIGIAWLSGQALMSVLFLAFYARQRVRTLSARDR